MRSSGTLRYAALLLAIFLAVDASFCDETVMAQQSSARPLTLTDRASSAGVVQVDCHSCICSGRALIETAPLHAPPLRTNRLATIDGGEPLSESRAIDIPPEKRV